MHVTCAGLTSLDLCFTVRSLSCRGRSCSWVCNTFSVILFLCFCTCSYVVTLLVSIFWIAFCQVCLIQAFTVFLSLYSWGQGLSSLKFSWAEGRGRGEHVASVPGQVWFVNSFPKATVLPRVNQWKPHFLVCCLTAPCRQQSSSGGWSAPLTPCTGWTVISVRD